MGGELTRAEQVLARLDRIGRVRELSEEESLLLERTLRRHDRQSGRRTRPWSKREDQKLERLIAKRARIGLPKPFTRNDEVRRIAADMGRTYWAVLRRIERLRKRAKGSSAAVEARV